MDASQLATPPVSSSRGSGDIFVPAIEDVDADQACEVATALCLRQRYEEALPFAEAALEEMKASHGSAHTRLCPYELLLAQCLLALHRLDAAATHCRRALHIFAAKPPSEKAREQMRLLARCTRLVAGMGLPNPELNFVEDKPTSEWTPSRHLMELEEWWRERGSHVQIYGATCEVVNDQPPNCFTSNCTRITFVHAVSPGLIPQVLDLLAGYEARVQQMDAHIRTDHAVATSYKKASHLSTREGLWYVCNFFVFRESTRDQLNALEITQLRRALEAFIVKKSNERTMTTSFALMDASPQRLDWHDWSAKDSGGQGEDPGLVALRSELTRAVADVERALEGRCIYSTTSTATNEHESSAFAEAYAGHTVLHISTPGRSGLMTDLLWCLRELGYGIHAAQMVAWPLWPTEVLLAVCDHNRIHNSNRPMISGEARAQAADHLNRLVTEFAALPTDDDREVLLNAMTFRMLPRGTVLVQEGSPSAHIGIITDGTLVLHTSHSRRSIVVSVGDSFGELALDDADATHPSCVEVMDPAGVWMLTWRVFRIVHAALNVKARLHYRDVILSSFTFRSLTPPQAQLLADVCWRTSVIKEHPSGKHVLLPGSRLSCMYFVMKGKLHVVSAEPPHRNMHVLATRAVFGFEALDPSFALVGSNEPLVIVDRIEAADQCLLLELSPMTLKAARLSPADLDPRGNFKLQLRGEPVHLVGDLRNPCTMEELQSEDDQERGSYGEPSPDTKMTMKISTEAETAEQQQRLIATLMEISAVPPGTPAPRPITSLEKSNLDNQEVPPQLSCCSTTSARLGSCISQPAVDTPARATEMRAPSSLRPLAVASLNSSEPLSGCLLLADDVDLVLAHGSLRSTSHWRITAEASTLPETRVAHESLTVDERRIATAALSRPSSTSTYSRSRGKSLRAAYPLLPLQPPEFPNAGFVAVQRAKLGMGTSTP